MERALDGVLLTMTTPPREAAPTRAEQACSIIAHYPTSKNTPTEVHWLIKQAGWGLGLDPEQSLELTHKVNSSVVDARATGFREGVEAAAKLIISRSEKSYDGCGCLGFMDPETGARECSLEIKGGDCLCSHEEECAHASAVAIRALIPASPLLPRN